MGHLLLIHPVSEQALDWVYSSDAELRTANYEQQVGSIARYGLGQVSASIAALTPLGYPSKLAIPNCMGSQIQWLREHQLALENPAEWISEITRKQIETLTPEVVVIVGEALIESNLLRSVSWRPQLAVAILQARCPADLSAFDLVLSPVSATTQRALLCGAARSEICDSQLAALLALSIVSESTINLSANHSSIQINAFTALLNDCITSKIRNRTAPSHTKIITTDAIPSSEASNEIESAVQLLNRNQNREALDMINRAIAERPQLPELQYGKALALTRLGFIDEARSVLVSLLLVRPHHEAARELLKEIETEGK